MGESYGGGGSGGGWGGNITPDVEEVIWLYDQTLKWMVSGFQVTHASSCSYCSKQGAAESPYTAGNAPRLS